MAGGGGGGGLNEIFLQTKSFRVNPGLFGAVLSLLLLCFVFKITYLDSLAQKFEREKTS